MVDYYSRDSPGAGTYSPDLSHKKFNQSTVQWSIPKERRFNGPVVESSSVNKKSNDSLENIHTLSVSNPGPGTYFGKFGESFMKNFKIHGKIGHERRFTEVNPFYKKDSSPGPAAYALQTHKSVYTNAGGRIVNGNQIQMSMTTLDSQGVFTSTFGNTYDKYKNVYHHEVSRDFQNREGPGPGTYNGDNSFRKTVTNLQYSFPKNDRKINDCRVKKDLYPAPTDFNFDESFKKIIKKDLMVKLGKAKREVDFTKYSAHHSTLVAKGLF